MRAVILAFRLDLARADILSRGNLIPLCLPPLFAVIFAAAGDSMDADFIGGGTMGAAFGLCSVMPMTVFSVEWQDNHRRMDGVIPATPARQVVGRYLALGLYAAVFVAELSVSALLATLIGGRAAIFDAGNLATTIAIALWGYLILQLILFPLFYRFTDPRYSMRLLLIVFGCLFVAIIALVALLPEAMADVAVGAAAGLLEHTVACIVVALGSLAAVAAVSLALSIRFRRAKEL